MVGPTVTRLTAAGLEIRGVARFVSRTLPQPSPSTRRADSIPGCPGPVGSGKVAKRGDAHAHCFGVVSDDTGVRLDGVRGHVSSDSNCASRNDGQCAESHIDAGGERIDAGGERTR